MIPAVRFRALQRWSGSAATAEAWTDSPTKTSPASAAEAPPSIKKKSCHGSVSYATARTFSHRDERDPGQREHDARPLHPRDPLVEHRRGEEHGDHWVERREHRRQADETARRRRCGEED